MPELEKPGPPKFKIGDKVRAKFEPSLPGLVAEIRRAVSPGRQHVYRVRVPMDPEPLWLEFRENDIEKV